MKSLGILFVLSAVLVVSGCKETAEEVSKAVSIKLDPSLVAKEKDLLKSDVLAMVNYKLSVGTEKQPDIWYRKVFGGATGLEALKFMDERVNYVLSQNVKLDDRITTGQLMEMPTNATVVASNVGVVLFLIQKAYQDLYNLRFTIGSEKIPLLSSHVGIIQLGAGYTIEKFKNGTPVTSIFRTSTLVHEARHSDCTNGVFKSDLERIRLGQVPKNLLCGQLHTVCPAGHDLAGYPACDSQPWGAYAVGAIYSSGLAKCTNCTELERQQAIADAVDEFSRVLVLEDMVSGKAGEPDMSSIADINPNRIRRSFQSFKRGRELEQDANFLLMDFGSAK